MNVYSYAHIHKRKGRREERREGRRTGSQRRRKISPKLLSTTSSVYFLLQIGLLFFLCCVKAMFIFFSAQDLDIFPAIISILFNFSELILEPFFLHSSSQNPVPSTQWSSALNSQGIFSFSLTLNLQGHTLVSFHMLSVCEQPNHRYITEEHRSLKAKSIPGHFKILKTCHRFLHST